MKYKKLSSGFLVADIESADTAVGLVRLAPKVLKSGAEQLARSNTYLFAANRLEISGASAAINATPAERQAHITAFLNDASHLVEKHSFLPDAGKGISPEDLAPLQAGDPRSKIRLTEMGPYLTDQSMSDCTLADYCSGVSAVTAIGELMEESGGLASKKVIIEGTNATTLGALDELEKSGAILIGLSIPDGFAYNPEGLDISALKSLAKLNAETDSSGQDMEALLNNQLEGQCEIKPAKAVFNTPADILFVGSKMGAVDHHIAETLEITALGSLHPIPYTARALAILERKKVVIPPDFLCLGGQIYPSWRTSEDSSPQTIIADVIKGTRELVQEVKNMQQTMNTSESKPDGNRSSGEGSSGEGSNENGSSGNASSGDESNENASNGNGSSLFLSGCKLAEDFMRTWQDELPFGRPLA